MHAVVSMVLLVFISYQNVSFCYAIIFIYSNSSGSKETATPTTTQSRPAGTAAGGSSADVAAAAGAGTGGVQQDAAAREDMLAIQKLEREPHDPFDDLFRLLMGLDKTDYSHVLIDDDGSVITENPTIAEMTGLKPR